MAMWIHPTNTYIKEGKQYPKQSKKSMLKKMAKTEELPKATKD